MPIRCRECEASRLPHDEHCTPEELAALRALADYDVARTARKHRAAFWIPYVSAADEVVELPEEDVA